MGSINMFDPNMAGLEGLQYNQKGGLSQASVGNVNLETGQPIPDPASMLRANASSTPLGAMQASTAANQAASGGGGMSNSDAFFASANASSAPRLVSTGPTAKANSNMATLNNLIASYKTASAKAQADQMAQYQELLKSVTGYTKNINALTDQLGAGNQQLIAKQGETTKGHAEQDLINRGLGNTTIRSSTLAGIDSNTALAQAQNASAVAGQKIGTQLSLSQMYGDALLSKNVQGPGNEYLQLIQSLANRG